MRRIIPHRPTTVVSSFCAAVDGCRATIAAAFPIAGDGGDPRPYVRTKPPTDIFVGQSACARKQLKNEERVRKALEILFRDYGGRAAQDDESDEEDDESDEEDDESVEEDEWKKMEEDEWKKMAKTKVSEEELNLFLTNLAIECERDNEKYEIVLKQFGRVIQRMNQEEPDAFLTNSYTTKLMNECEPKYEKRLREIIEKVRKKMIQDDGIMGTLELITNLMSKREPEYEKLLREVLDKVCEKITQDNRDEIGGNENIRKIEKLTKLGMKVGKICSFEEKLDGIVTITLKWILKDFEHMKPYFMAYEVIEKVAKNVGNEKVRKIAEKKLDEIVTHAFVDAIVDFQMNIPCFKFMTWSLVRKLEVAA